VAVRTRAVKMGLKINEYGVYKGSKQVAGATEEEVYAAVGLRYIEPELRENRGEIAAAQDGTLPKLVETHDIKGDLHTHSTATDGRNSILEMARAARKAGLSYMAVTDHTKRLAMVGGLDEKRLAEQIEEIERINETLEDFIVLKGSEVDILDDGRLDLDDGILRELDLCICSIHQGFHLSREKQTERVLRAMDNRHFNILAHPTGRLLGDRAPYEIDLERIMRAAVDRGCFLEASARPERLDLNGPHCRAAKEMGLKVAINTDSHSIEGLGNLHYGVEQARRGGLTADDVLNTRDHKTLKALLKRS
jgi:DNA polymerase (family 10)